MPDSGGSSKACPRGLSAAMLLVVALAMAAAAPAAAGNTAAAPAGAGATNSTACYYATHFVVAAGLPACQSRCKSKLAAAGGGGSICPKIYTTNGEARGS